MLFPATSIDPSEAIVTDRIGTSASGTCADTHTTNGLSRVSIRRVDDHVQMQRVWTDQLVRARVLCEIPDLYTPVLVAADELPLIWMDHHVIDW